MISQLLRQLAVQAGLRNAAINTSWLFTDKLIRSVVDLGLVMLMAQQLGLAAVGALAWAMSVVLILQSLVGLGLDTVALKELVVHPRMRSDIVGSVFILRLAAGGFVFVSVVVISQVVQSPAIGSNLKLTAILAGMLVPYCTTAFDLWFAAQTRAKDILLPRFLAFGIALPVKVLSLIVWRDLSVFATMVVCEACLSAILASYAYRARNSDNAKLRFRRDIAVDLMRQSIPQLGLGFFTMLQARSDQIILGQLLGEAALGRYALALRVIELAAGILTVVMASVSPALAHAYVRDSHLFNDRVLNSYRLMIMVSFVISVPILLSAWMAELIYSRASELALTALLVILIPRLMLTGMGLVKTQYLTNKRLLHWGLATAMIGASANLVGNSMLIPSYGIPGAIVASSFSFLLQIVLLDALHPTTRGNFSLMLQGLFTFWKFRIT